MKSSENLLYKCAIQSIRCENLRVGEWFGKPDGAPAVTRYPNLVAEFAARGPHIGFLARKAGVTRAIMAAVLEDNEGLTVGEMCGISESGYWGGLSYLTTPVLQVVNPATKAGIVKRRKLNDMQFKVAYILDWKRERIIQTMEELNCGNPVTYADWRFAYESLKEAVAEVERPVRNVRTVPLT